MAVWDDPELMDRLATGRKFMSSVFGLDRTAEFGDWRDVTTRIVAGELTKRERENLASVNPRSTFADFVRDVEAARLPRVFDELDDQIDQDLGAWLKNTAETEWTAHSGKPPTPDQVSFIADSAHRSLLWRIVQNCVELRKELDVAGTIEPTLRSVARELIEFLARPEKVFADFDLLKDVGDEWTDLKKTLGLAGSAKQITREIIDERKEARGLGWPSRIKELFGHLQDSELTPRFHVVLAGCIKREIQGRMRRGLLHFNDENERADFESRALNEFIEIIAYQIIKNSPHWSAYTTHGATSWGPRIFNNLGHGARRAVNFALGGSARGGGLPDEPGPGPAPLGNLPAPAIPTPDREKDARRAAMLKAIQKLPEPERSVLFLQIGNDPDTMKPIAPLSVREIADRLNLADREVKLAAQRGTSLLKNILKIFDPDTTGVPCQDGNSEGDRR